MDVLQPVVLYPREGRHYNMGAISATFKADETETQGRFSASEWFLEPMHEGPGPHKHDENDEIFYVLHGTASIRVGDEWKNLPTGSFCFIPRGVTHDFRNETVEPMSLLNIFLPGSFEQMMPIIADWYRSNPAKRIGQTSDFS